MVRDLSIAASMEPRDLNRPFVQPDASNRIQLDRSKGRKKKKNRKTARTDRQHSVL
jgi:hypothetical protein